jgi:hypothetical protein
MLTIAPGIGLYVMTDAQSELRRFPYVIHGRVLHVDGDYLAVYCAGKDECEPGRARQNVFGRIETTRLLSGSEKVVVHLSSTTALTSRDAKRYHRDRNGRRPKNWDYLREVLEGYEGPKFWSKLWPTGGVAEGIAYCSSVADIAISTRNKDLSTLPGLHINWTTQELTFVPRA